MKVPHTHIEKALGLLYEYVFCPIAAEQELIKERGVILSEFNDFWHTPEKRFIFESWKRRFKMEGHPYSYRPLGRPETINTFDRKKVLAWRERYYHPSNMTLGIAGNIDLKKIKKIIESFFGQDKEGKKHEEPVFDSNGYSSFSFHHMEDKRPQISFYLSFPAFGWRNENRHERSVLWLLNTLLAGSRTSRLYMRLREREGSVYHVGGNYSLNSYLGVEEITGSTPIEKLIFTLRALREEIDNLLNNSIADKELERAKQLISSKILMGFDNPEGANSYFTPQVFYEEEVWTPERQIKDIEKVTKEEVNKWTKKILDYSRVNINLLGNVPDKSKADIEKIFR